MTAVALIAASTGALACADVEERNSLRVRTLQTRLMVAALTCDARAPYNAFVTHYRPALVVHANRLTGYFDRQFGRRSVRVLDRYVTGLANRASARSITDRKSFCAANDETFTGLLGVGKNERETVLLRTAVERVTQIDTVATCEIARRK